MNEARSLGWIILAIFVLLGMGAYFSPSYTQQITYAEGFLFAGALLFIASIVILVAAFGFHTFALYLAVLTGMAIALTGWVGGVTVLLLTYVSWGFAFSLQLLLAYHHVSGAMEWFRSHYTFAMFMSEYRAFYPLLWGVHLLLERIPNLLQRKPTQTFRPGQSVELMKKILR